MDHSPAEGSGAQTLISNMRSCVELAASPSTGPSSAARRSVSARSRRAPGGPAPPTTAGDSGRLAAPLVDDARVSGPSASASVVEQAGHVVRRHLGRPAAHDGRRHRVADRARRCGRPSERERQDAVVAQSSTDRLRRGPTEQRHVVGRRCLGIDRRCRCVECADAVEPAEQAADGSVEVRLVDVALLDGVDHGGSETPGPGPASRGRVRHRATPSSRSTANQSVITRPSKPHSSRRMSSRNSALLGQPAPVEPVVRRHDGQRPALADRELEGHEVELAQRALVDDRADGRPLELGVVADEVLDGGEDAFGLDARARTRRRGAPRGAGPRSSTRSCVRPAVSGAGSPSGRAAPGSRGRALPVPTSAPSASAQRRVPRRADGRAARDAGRGSAAHARERIPPGAVGTVGDVDLGDAEALDRNGGQHVLSRSESSLLFKRQRINQRFDIRQFAAPVLAL